MRPSRSERGVRDIDARLLASWPIHPPTVEGDKEARGRVLVIGGARQMPGAIILAATAALRAGAGKLQIATVATVAPHVAVAIPEAYVEGVAQSADGGFGRGAQRRLVDLTSRVRSLLIGPGMIENRALPPLMAAWLSALRPDQVAVVDAGALTCMAKHRDRLATAAGSLIVTPHAGEMAALFERRKEDIQSRPVQMVVEAARALDAVTVLKGAETLISDGTRVYRNVSGNVGLATSGSGDTLSGVIAGLAARGADPMQAAVWGVHLHGCAGDTLARKVAPLGYLARELLDEIPRLLATPSARRQRR